MWKIWTDQRILAVWSEMAQVDSRIGYCGIVEVVLSTLYKENLQIRIGFGQTTGCDA
jgi:enhancing lycopene biosynthesis protein 2